MSDILLLCTILGIHCIAMMSPGPDFAMAIKNAILHGRKIGFATALGFATGIAVHITYCLLGLAVIISQSIIIYNILKYAGAAYLLYVGIKSFFAKDNLVNIDTKKQSKKRKTLTGGFVDGFITNLLNPKATLYFLSLFTIILTPQTPSWIYGTISIVIPLLAVVWFSLVTLFFTAKPMQRLVQKSSKILNKICGSIMIMLGIKVATD